MLSADERKRYARQITLREIGEEGQLRLKQSRILVIGAGGLGSPALIYLAAAGIGTIGIVDFDRVDATNLHRQILYGPADIGKEKAALAAGRVKSQNPEVSVNVHEVALSRANAMEIIAEYDIIVDGSDNLPTRYLVNDACVFLEKPLVYGAIFQFEGQVSVFNQLEHDGQRGPNYRDLFPQPPPPALVPSCAEGGVIGVLPGIIGSLQANEAIKLAAQIGTTLSGRLWMIDSLDFSTRTLKIRKDPANPLTGENPTQSELIDYDQFCNPARTENDEITPTEVNALMVSQSPFQLIDVRETYEYDEFNLGALSIPLADLASSVKQINRHGLVVIHCQTGQRSRAAVEMLRRDYGFGNLKSMTGGIRRWRLDIG